MKKLLVMTLSAVMVLSLAACGSSQPAATSETTEENTSIANPWGDYDSLEEAEEAAGFSYSFGDVISCGSLYATEYRAMEGMLEVTYYPEGSTDEADACTIRQAKETDEDISGDYNTYSDDTTVEDCGIDEIRLRGNDGALSLCTFDYDGYSFVIYPGNLTYEEILTIIGELTGIDPAIDTAAAEGEAEGDGAPIVAEERLIDTDAIDLLAIAGSYSGIEYSELDLSMYTSTDNNYVGIMELYDADGNVLYSGEIQEIATNYFGLAGENVDFTVYTDNGVLGLDLYINGEHADYFVMTEHYES